MLTGTMKEKFLRLRREFIARENAGLNDMQLRAVLATEGPLLVLAGAGSGKTTVLIQRVANIIKYGKAGDTTEVYDSIDESDVEFLERYLAEPNDYERDAAERLCAHEPASPWNVIAITFTNKAANELKSRLAARLGERANDVWASTFHSACVRILRRDIERLGYGRDFTIYDSSDSERLMKAIVTDLKLEENSFAPKTVLGYISRAKDKMIFPGEYEAAFAHENAYRASRIAAAYGEYAKRMKAANALDFDDLILLTVQLLLQHDDVREYYQRKFKYVLIDEYQDTNNLQYLLASTLAGGWGNLCVVGDDDQSIYRFRGATVENILTFDSQNRGTRVIKLEQNYRSTKTILAVANSVIEHNAGRKGKALWPSTADGEKVVVYNAADDNDEAGFIAKEILAAVGAGGHFRDHAILYRMNAQSNRVEDAFKRGGIPYRIIGGTRFFDRAEIKDVLAYLWVVHNHADDLRLGRILNVPARGIGKQTQDAVEFFANSTGVSMFDICESASDYDALAGRSAAKLHAFADMINYLSHFSESCKPSELYDELLEKTGYVLALQAKVATDPEAQGRIENVLELKSSIISYENENDEPTLGGFLDEISLFTDIEKYDEGADAVVLMTLHSAKGLEFPTVFMVGVEEGIFPGMRSTVERDDLEEERRLCYVGITRARKKLYITCAKRRMIFGRTSFNPPSRFVDELPDACIDEQRSEQLEQKREQRFGFSFDSDDDAPRGGFGGRSGYSGYASGGQRGGYGRSVRSQPQRSSYGGSNAVSKAGAPSMKLEAGDRVTHSAFGAGEVVSVKAMGGDALIEIDFDTAGKKRLMLKTAANFLKKG